MQIGQSVHLSDIKLPEGVKSAVGDDVTLCAITAQAKEEEAPAEAAAAEVPATNQKAPCRRGSCCWRQGCRSGQGRCPAKGAAPAAAAPAKKK